MRKFCFIVSRIFDFHFWAPVTLFLALFNTNLDFKQIELLAPILLVFDIFIPVGTHLFLLKTGKISSFDVPKRQQRTILFAVGTACAFVSTIFAIFIADRLFIALHVALFFLTLFVVTLKWKISGHMLVNSSAILMISFILGWQYAWLFLLLPIVAFVRIYLKIHTFAQIVAGTIVGLAEPFIILKLFGFL